MPPPRLSNDWVFLKLNKLHSPFLLKKNCTVHLKPVYEKKNFRDLITEICNDDIYCDDHPLSIMSRCNYNNVDTVCY